MKRTLSTVSIFVLAILGFAVVSAQPTAAQVNDRPDPRVDPIHTQVEGAQLIIYNGMRRPRLGSPRHLFGPYLTVDVKAGPDELVRRLALRRTESVMLERGWHDLLVKVGEKKFELRERLEEDTRYCVVVFRSRKTGELDTGFAEAQQPLNTGRRVNDRQLVHDQRRAELECRRLAFTLERQ